MSQQQKDAHQVLDQAIDTATAKLQGVNPSKSQSVFDEYNAKIDEAGELDSIRSKQKPQTQKEAKKVTPAIDTRKDVKHS